MIGRRILGLALLLTLAAPGCDAMKKAGRFVALQKLLATEFQDPGVQINVKNDMDGSALTINFMHARNADLPDAEKEVFARKVAELIRDRYPEYREFQSIQISFRGAGVVVIRTADLETH